MQNSLIGRIHSIESMGLVDGPGIRSVVFFQGCILRCKYCHNPDTWKEDENKLSLSPKELVDKLVRFKQYFGKDGGVTFSGGEPLLQIDFVIESFKLLKQHGIHTCLDTSGVGLFHSSPDYVNKLEKLFSVTDLVLLDVKHYEENKYKQITGKEIGAFNLFLNVLQQTDVPLWIRHVIVPNLTNGINHIEKLKEYVNQLKNVQKIELLPYHVLGVDKYKKLGISYQLDGILPPTKAEMDEYQKIINEKEL